MCVCVGKETGISNWRKHFTKKLEYLYGVWVVDRPVMSGVLVLVLVCLFVCWLVIPPASTGAVYGKTKGSYRHKKIALARQTSIGTKKAR